MSVQECLIRDWLPASVANGSRQKHWATLRKEAEVSKTTAWGAVKHAGWEFQPGRVRLTITLTFPSKRKRDQDNLYARVKHVVDGIKGCFFTDDSTDVLELVVRAVDERGVKSTHLRLEPTDGEAFALPSRDDKLPTLRQARSDRQSFPVRSGRPEGAVRLDL